MPLAHTEDSKEVEPGLKELEGRPGLDPCEQTEKVEGTGDSQESLLSPGVGTMFNVYPPLQKMFDL